MPGPDFRALLGPRSPAAARPPAPAPVTGRELQELLQPMSCEEFVRSHFAQVAVNLTGHPGRFDRVFGWERLREALERGKSITDKRYNIRAARTSGEDSSSEGAQFDAEGQEVSELLESGATLCISNIHMADPALAEYAQALRAQLNFTGTVGVHCYVSSDNSGLPMHYDRRVSTTLQISGRKRWKFSTRAAQAWPLDNFVVPSGKPEEAWAHAGTPPAGMEMREVELAPGDLLCLPAGAWHSACGIGHSLALNVYFSPRSFFQQLAPLLEAFAAQDGNWRGGPPATLGKVAGALPGPVKAYMKERLEEFHRMALALVDDPEALAEGWLDALAREPYTGWQPFLNKPMTGVTPEQRFRVAVSSLHFIEATDCAIASSDYGPLRFPARMIPLLRRLASTTEPFTIPQLLSWYPQAVDPPAEQILALVKTLYQGGLLRIA